jgi:hypothetical protein
MQRIAPFRLNRNGLLLALISAGFAGEAAAAAARVDFTMGAVTVAGRDGAQRPLAKGAQLDTGDTVRTNDGRAQLRFTDGSYVSLQPNTDFAISDYKFDGKSDDRGFFGLVRGAMRTVTGAVGRVNRNSYRITTPTATVGIRGTGGVVQVLPDGATLVIGTSGIWSLTNPAGSIDVPAGVSGLAPKELNTPPRETTTQPQARPAEVVPEKREFTKGEEVNEEGKPVIETAEGTPAVPTVPVVPPPTFTPLASGTGYHVAAVHTNNAGQPAITFVSNQTATFDATGRLTQFNSGGVGSGSHANFGSDGILAWGRWTGTIDVAGTPQTLSSTQGYHYVVGKPTVTMPTGGATATYSLVGASSPTYMSGTPGPGTVTGGTITAAFTPSTMSIGLSGFTVQMPDRTYTMNQSPSATMTSSLFSLNPTVGNCATSTCSSTVLGFFAGTNAERIGIGYNISDGVKVYGAAAFAK